MRHRCVCDISHLGVPRRMCADFSAIYRRWFLAMKHRVKMSIFSRFPDVFVKHGDYHVRRRSFAELLAHGGAAMAMLKFVHRETIGNV